MNSRNLRCLFRSFLIAGVVLGSFAPSVGAAPSDPPVERHALRSADGKSYELPTGYKFGDKSCPSGLPGTRKDDTTINFPAVNIRNEFRGFNLQATHGGRCQTLQVLLLPPGVSDANTQQLQELGYAVPPRPVGEPQGEVDKASPHGGVRLLSNQFQVTPKYQSPVVKPDVGANTWYFATTTSIREKLEVTLPTIEGRKYYVCAPGRDKGTDKFTFNSGEPKKIEVKVTTDADKCDKTESRWLQRSLADALALDQTARTAVESSLGLVPIEGAAGDVGVRVKGLFASDVEFREHNDISIPGFEPVGPRCKADSCLYVFHRTAPLAIGEDSFQVELESGGRLLLEAGIDSVFKADGSRLTLSNVVKKAVSSWDFGTDVITITISPGLDSQTEIAIPDAIARLLSPKTYLNCKVGTDAKARCAEFVRRGNGGALRIIDADARKALAGADKSVEIELKADVQLTDGKGGTVRLALLTNSCQFSLRQLTRAVGGLQGGTVLYRVEAQPRACLCGDLDLVSKEEAVSIRAASWAERAPDCRSSAPQARLLRASVASTARSSERKRYTLEAQLGGHAVEPLPNAPALELMVEPSLDVSTIRIDPEISVQKDGQTPLQDQPHLAAGIVNRVLIPRTLSQPWRVSLVQTGNFIPTLPNPRLHGSEIRVRLDAPGLSSASIGESNAYFVKTRKPAAANPQLLASLEGRVDAFLVDGAEALLEGLNLPRDTNLVLGSETVTLSNVETKRYYLPSDLKSAQVVCGWREGWEIVRGVGVGDPARPYNWEQYRNCALRIDVPEGVTPEDFVGRGPQRIAVTLKKGTGNEQPVDLGHFSPKKTDIQYTEYCAKEETQPCPGDKKRRAYFLMIPLGNVLDKAGEVDDYAQVTLTARHATDSDLQTSVPGVFFPTSLSEARNSELVARTILIPGGTFGVSSYDGGTWRGYRTYFAGTANVSLVRSRDRGFDVKTSSDYADKVAANFGYGVLLVTERWNFSDNRPIIPVFAPQFSVGLLGPTTFDRGKWWKDFSLVAGLGFRLPAASKPEAGKTEAQSGLILWYELTCGARDTPIHSILLGFNVAVGALAP